MDRKDYDRRMEEALDEALAETFPASDPVALSRRREPETGGAAPSPRKPLKPRPPTPSRS